MLSSLINTVLWKIRAFLRGGGVDKGVAYRLRSWWWRWCCSAACQRGTGRGRTDRWRWGAAAWSSPSCREDTRTTGLLKMLPESEALETWRRFSWCSSSLIKLVQAERTFIKHYLFSPVLKNIVTFLFLFLESFL